MFSNAVRIFTLSDFEVRVDPSWLLIAALITWTLSQQYFPISNPGHSNLVYLGMALIAMLGFFASLLLHEMAHSVVARRFGVGIKGITLFLFGGVAEMEQEPQTAGVEFWVALAGPAMSLFLSFSFWLTSGVADLVRLHESVVEVLSYLAMINLILALFNLVPAFPLDGGRVLRAYLWSRSGNVLKATEIAARSGTIFAYVLMGFGLLFLFQGAQIAGLWQILIGGFLLFAARSSYQNQLARAAFEGKTVQALTRKDVVQVSPDTSLLELADQVMLRHRVSFVPVVDGQILLGHIDNMVLGDIDRENWASTRVGDVFAGLDPEICIAPDMPVQDLLAHIGRTGRRKFLVTKDHGLVGVITLADLMDYLRLSHLLKHGSK